MFFHISKASKELLDTVQAECAKPTPARFVLSTYRSVPRFWIHWT
jgi:hypothetical protein